MYALVEIILPTHHPLPNNQPLPRDKEKKTKQNKFPKQKQRKNKKKTTTTIVHLNHIYKRQKHAEVYTTNVYDRPSERDSAATSTAPQVAIQD